MKNKLHYFLFLFIILQLSNLYSQPAGTAGKVEWLIWNNIPSNDLEFLYHSHQYDKSPDNRILLRKLATPTNYNDRMGGMLRGYIIAPETGNYQFNITGDDQSVLFLSTDTTRQNLEEIAFSPSSTGETNHDQHASQTSDNIWLVAGEYYYFEAIYYSTEH